MSYDLDVNHSLRSLPVLLLVALVLTMPIPDFRINNIVIVALFLYSLSVSQHSLINVWSDSMLFIPGTLFALYLIGLPWAEDLGAGWFQVEKRLPLVAFPVALFFMRKKLYKEDITLILYAFVVVCFVLTVICYGNALLQVVDNQSFMVVEGTERKYYYFSYLYLTRAVKIDPIYLSLYINFSIVILLLRPLKKWASLNTILILYLIVFQLLIASKIGIACLAIVLLIRLGSSIRNKYVATIVVISIPSIFIVVILNLPFLRDRFIVQSQFSYQAQYSGDWNSISQRLAIWSCAIEAIEKRFPFGYGTSNGQSALESIYIKQGYVRGYQDHYNAHSEFLYTTLDFGIPGLAFLLVVLVLPLIIAIRRGNKMIMYFHFLIILYGCVEVILTRRYGIIFYSFFYAILAAMPKLPNQKQING
jgi:O-antigen ligase